MVLPGADRIGIETTNHLKSESKFTIPLKYLGKDNGFFSDEGTFLWNENGSKIAISSEQGESQKYPVGENVLFHFDKDVNRILCELTEKFKLPQKT